MSCFLFIAVPENIEGIETRFALPFQLFDVTDTPLGKAARGNRKKGKAYVVAVHGHSGSIIEPSRKSMLHFPSLFKDAVAMLLCDLPGVSFLIHWCKGGLVSEEVTLKGKVSITFNEFNRQFPHCEEDTRYIVSPRDLYCNQARERNRYGERRLSSNYASKPMMPSPDHLAH